MQKFWLLIYNIVVIPLLYTFFYLSSLKSEKVRKGIRGRKNWKNSLSEILKRVPHPDRIFLFHVVSVGELQQALPLIRLMKNKYKNISVGISFFSPSGYEFYKPDPDIDFICYMPFDTYSGAKAFFRIVKPVCWFVVKHDIWLNHLYRCYKDSIPTVLIAATLPESSKRAAPVIRSMNHAFYNKFTKILPISEPDKKRFSMLYDKPEEMVITGDTRYDQVVYRSRHAREKAEKLPLDIKNRIYFMLGSIWDTDETVVIPPAIRILHEFPDICLLATPHEPEEKILSSLESSFNNAGIKSVRLSSLKDIPQPDNRVVIIDKIGILAQLYSISIFAYVGGSFGPGVHNVMEPAIMGIPVMFGVKHTNSLEAMQMKEQGGGFEVKNSQDFENITRKLLNSEEFMNNAGAMVKKFVLDNTGAADKIMDTLEHFFEDIISGNNSD